MQTLVIMTGKVPVNDFTFHELFEIEDVLNGMCFNNIYVPEEVLMNIFCYVPSKKLLRMTTTCKRWCNIIKSSRLWMSKYKKHFPGAKAKNLPWYVYYCYFATDNFTNLIRNGNGEEEFRHWKQFKPDLDKFKIEDPPEGCDPLPSGIPEFHGYTSCFVASHSESYKAQVSIDYVYGIIVILYYSVFFRAD